MPALIRSALLHIPILGGWLERRWMSDPIERDRHREVVRARLEAPMPPVAKATHAESEPDQPGAVE